MQILHAEEYKRPDFIEILSKTWDLLVKYAVQKIHIDGANPSFIKSLKIQWGERPDYGKVKKEHRQYMKVELINFNQEHKEMLGHCKMLLERGYIAINPAFGAYRLALKHYRFTTRELEE